LSLLRWQAISLISKFIAVGIGIAQGIFIVRILTPADYGLVGIVAAVGSVVGVYQHLGLASGTTREISAVSTKKEAFKVFLSGIIARYSISVPLAVGLFVLSSHIANNIYHQPTILGPLRLYAGILLLQAGQDVCNSVLAGLQRFKKLFLFQAIIALVSFSLYVPLVYYYKFWGYFVAMFFLTLISVSTLWFLALKSFEGKFVIPKVGEVKKILKGVFSVGLSVYAAKIAYTFWQKIGPLFLGTILTPAQVGFFNFATYYSNKILTVSDALTDVNLPVMTKKITEDIVKYRIHFLNNFEKVYSFMLFAALSGIYWAKDLIHLLIGTKYDSSLYLIPILVLSFFLYGLINFLGASVIVPARLLWQLIISYGLLIGGTLATYYLGAPVVSDPSLKMALAMSVGAAVAVTTMSIYSYRKVGILLTNRKIFLITISQIPLIYFNNLDLGFILRAVFYIINCLLIILVLNNLKVVEVKTYAKRLGLAE